VSYISPAYGGSVSDRQLVVRSNLAELCEPGDSVMADKGFNVQDIFEAKGITVHTPTFLTGKNKLSASTVRKDRKISSKGPHVSCKFIHTFSVNKFIHSFIHSHDVEIGLGKTLRILRYPLTKQETFSASQIAYICLFL